MAAPKPRPLPGSHRRRRHDARDRLGVDDLARAIDRLPAHERRALLDRLGVPAPGPAF